MAQEWLVTREAQISMLLPFICGFKLALSARYIWRREIGEGGDGSKDVAAEVLSRCLAWWVGLLSKQGLWRDMQVARPDWFHTCWWVVLAQWGFVFFLLLSFLIQRDFESCYEFLLECPWPLPSYLNAAAAASSFFLTFSSSGWHSAVLLPGSTHCCDLGRWWWGGLFPIPFSPSHGILHHRRRTGQVAKHGVGSLLPFILSTV